MEPTHGQASLNQTAVFRDWACPQCTLSNSSARTICAACGLQRRRPRRTSGSTASSRGGSDSLAGYAIKAAIAGAAGLLIGRASTHTRLQHAAATVLALSALPLANLVASRLLGPPGGGAAAPQRGSQRRRQLLRVAQQAGDAGSMLTAEEQQLLQVVMQPAASRTERFRTISRVLQWLQSMDTNPAPRSRSRQLVTALVVHELNSLVDEMDYDELHQAFGGHPPAKGLRQEDVAALPHMALTAEAIACLNSYTCCVCLEAFEAGEMARVLPGCDHAFHAACLDPWLLSKAVCPICRAAVEAPCTGGSCG